MSARSATLALAALSQLAELAADVLKIPPVVPGRQGQRRCEEPSPRVGGECAPVDAEVLRRLSGGQELRRGRHSPNIGVAPTSDRVRSLTIAIHVDTVDIVVGVELVICPVLGLC
jgi:hypothetical protein